jgi:hypothetical protein
LGEDLDGEAAAVDVVAEEEILGGFQRSSGVVVDQFDEIVELPMDISDDSDWILDLDEVGLGVYIS